MILVDTSVWVAHFRRKDSRLVELLDDGNVACHPFIIGELACGNLNNRGEILYLLQSLPAAVTAEHEEVMQFVNDNRLMGRGLGYIDMHLLVSALLTQVAIWTHDKKLHAVSAQYDLSY
jgi:predicted nucleic acid-binding protein